MPDDRSSEVQRLIDRLRAGDESARNDLVNCACERLRRLTRKMLKGFPVVRIYEQTDGVLDESAMRLRDALKDVNPPSVRDFFQLAALKIRQVLLDRARYWSRGPAAGPQPTPPERVDSSNDPSKLIDWTEFHQTIESLPDEMRVLFDLLYYQKLAQSEVAALLGVSVRTLKRRWQLAKIMLVRTLEGELPF